METHTETERQRKSDGGGRSESRGERVRDMALYLARERSEREAGN